MNTDFWLDKITRKSRHTLELTSLAAKQVCFGPVEHGTCIDFVAKSRTTLYFLQQLFATCNYLICFKTGLKKRNIAFRLILQQCCKRILSCTFLLPDLPYLRLVRIFVLQAYGTSWLNLGKLAFRFVGGEREEGAGSRGPRPLLSVVPRLWGKSTFSERVFITLLLLFSCFYFFLFCSWGIHFPRKRKMPR